MARQIIILETNPADGGQKTVRCVFWFAIAAGSRIPLPSFVSEFKTPTTEEATALQDGSVVEEVHTYHYPNSYNATSIRAALAAAWTDRKAWRDAQPNTGQFYGSSWDGTTWANP